MFTKKINQIEKSIDFFHFKRNFNSEMECVEGYLKNNDLFIKFQKKKLELKLDNQIEKDISNESIFQNLYEEEIKTLTSFYYHSSISLIHSTLENSLTELCLHIQKETNNKFSVIELGNRDLVSKSIDYLKITCGIKNTAFETVWPDIKKYQILRNKIIHQNSTYKDAKDKTTIEKLFPNKIEFDDQSKRFYVKDNSFVLKHLERSKELINLLIDILEEKEFILVNVNQNDANDLPF